MENLVRLLHTPEFDRSDLMTRQTFKKCPNLDEITLILNSAILEIESSSGTGIKLGYFFTNIFNKKVDRSGQKAITIGFHPINDLVEYEFRDDNDFWIKPHPKVIELFGLYYPDSFQENIKRSWTNNKLTINRILFYKNTDSITQPHNISSNFYNGLFR